MQGVDANWLVNMVAFLVGVAGILFGALQVSSSRRAQKRDVTMLEEFATRKELLALTEKFEGRFEDLRCEIREDKTEILKAGEERAVKLHERCNAILQAVSEVRGELHSNRSYPDGARGGRKDY